MSGISTSGVRRTGAEGYGAYICEGVVEALPGLLHPEEATLCVLQLGRLCVACRVRTIILSRARGHTSSSERNPLRYSSSSRVQNQVMNAAFCEGPIASITSAASVRC